VFINAPDASLEYIYIFAIGVLSAKWVLHKKAQWLSNTKSSSYNFLDPKIKGIESNTFFYNVIKRLEYSL